MLSMSELAMNPNRKVTTVCYGKKQEWDDREEASAYRCRSSSSRRSRRCCLLLHKETEVMI